MVAHACNPSTLGGRDRRISEFEVSLVYKSEFQDSQDYTEKPCLRKNQNQTNKTKTKKQLGLQDMVMYVCTENLEHKNRLTNTNFTQKIV